MKDAIILSISKRAVLDLSEQINQNNVLKGEIAHYNDENERIARNVDELSKKGASALRKAEDSRRAVEESSNRYMAIIALLVSLLAIIFANISEFLSAKITWESAVILNSSVLLAACIIFSIIENGHLFSLKVLGNEHEKHMITVHQVVFNILIVILSLLLISAMICGVYFSNIAGNFIVVGNS